MTTSNTVNPCEFRSFCFRGEGAANFVISAKSELSGSRIVWRLAKHRKSGTVSSNPKCHIVTSYLEKHIIPFVGREFILKPQIVKINLQCLHNLAKVICEIGFC
ncbi:hypothetical protein AB6A40_011624 [Gnathostoma spinigerum]|uniref:Inositol-pentakisphosphate 2-kinase n=1 Tax=Gnathostoma spinigerum TaxID=75299 RepID=A0ABD6F4V7_9BILA